MNQPFPTYILTDIEGTTSDIKFVKEVLFPYAAQHLPDFIRAHESQPAVAAQLTLIAEELGCASHDLDTIIQGVLGWIQADLKKTPLKALQGQVWRSGYLSGDFTGHLYGDAHQHLKTWSSEGIKLGVYSSGSVEAQRLLFGYSDFGDVTSFFSDYFDTRVGHKREPDAYRKIAHTLLERGQIHEVSGVLFLSDVAEELDAAHATGMKTAELRRDGEEGSRRHPRCADFHEVSALFIR